MDESSSQRTTWRQALFLVTVSVVLVLFLAESALRWHYWRKGIGRGDVREILLRSQRAGQEELGGGSGLFGVLEPSEVTDLVYQLKPHLGSTFLGARLETNRFGLRGPEIDEKKPPGTVRVVGIGDSHMFGWAMEQGDEYLRLLERELNVHAVPGTTFEVLNFGTPGYNTVMEVATFEHRALGFEPDVVIVHWVGNDFDPPHFLEEPRGFEPSRWYLLETVAGLFGDVEDEFDVGDGSEPEPKETLSASRRRYRHLAGAGAVGTAMRRLALLASERDLPVLFMIFGESSGPRRRARDAALEAGFWFFNPSPYFLRALDRLGVEPSRKAVQRTFSRSDQHPTRAGHQVYAEALRCELGHLDLGGLERTVVDGCLELLSRSGGGPR